MGKSRGAVGDRRRPPTAADGRLVLLQIDAATTGWSEVTLFDKVAAIGAYSAPVPAQYWNEVCCSARQASRFNLPFLHSSICL
jgi:hypothetical protein